jgi:hypothetical protein
VFFLSLHESNPQVLDGAGRKAHLKRYCGKHALIVGVCRQ